MNKWIQCHLQGIISNIYKTLYLYIRKRIPRRRQSVWFFIRITRRDSRDIESWVRLLNILYQNMERLISIFTIMAIVTSSIHSPPFNNNTNLEDLEPVNKRSPMPSPTMKYAFMFKCVRDLFPVNAQRSYKLCSGIRQKLITSDTN